MKKCLLGIVHITVQYAKSQRRRNKSTFISIIVSDALPCVFVVVSSVVSRWWHTDPRTRLKCRLSTIEIDATRVREREYRGGVRWQRGRRRESCDEGRQKGKQKGGGRESLESMRMVIDPLMANGNAMKRDHSIKISSRSERVKTLRTDGEVVPDDSF